MANAIAFSSDDTGTPASTTAPGDVSGIVVNYAFIDPVALQITLSVSFTPPAGGSYTGVHLWLEIPDQSGGITPMITGSTPVGTGTLVGPWAPIDLGLFQAPKQPWIITLAFPAGLNLNPNQNIACRLYLASYSSVVDNTLVRNGLMGATPNVAFELVSLSSGSSSAGTNVTTNCGTVTCDVLPNQNVSGKLVTPVLVLMGGVPSNPPKGWGYRLYISYGTADPTNPANLTPVTDVETVAGVVPAPTKSDGVSILHSFAIATPASVTGATIWALAGLTVNGAFTPNNLVPGITNGCPIVIGTDTGTIDASQAILASIEAKLSLATGKLGLTPGGINAAVYLGATTVTGTLLATSGIITLSAQIGLAVIADANIGNMNVSKLLAGTATFTSNVLFQNSFGGPAVAITSTGVSLTGGAFTVGITSSTGISISQASGPSLALTGSGLTMTNGSYQMVLTSSSLQLTNGTASVTVSGTSVAIVQGNLTLTAGGITTAINNNSFGPTGRNSALVCSSGSFSCGVDYLGLFAEYAPGGSPAFGSVGVTTAGGYVSLSSTAGDAIVLGFGGGTLPSLGINGVQVVGARQSGPGTPSFSSFAQVQTWCQNLLTALQNHGLVT